MNKINNFDSRSLILIIIVCICSIILIGRLFNLQIINGESYRAQAEKRLIRNVDTYAPRGDIYDRNGVLLATSKVEYNIELYKTKKTNKELNDLIVKLISIFEKNGDEYLKNLPKDITEEEIQKLISKYELEDFDDEIKNKILQVRYELSNSGYTNYRATTIAKDVSINSVLEIEENNHEISGVYVQKDTKRFYPYENTLSHIIGYTGKISETEYEKKKETGYRMTDTIGKSGIENSFEKYLRGQRGIKRVEMDSQGIINFEEEIEKSRMGDDIYLTVDIELQKKTEEVLANMITDIHDGKFNRTKYDDATCGSAVVLDIKTGEVLAIASYPDYNPQDFVDGINNEEYEKYFNNKDAPMFNRAIQGLYPPGSTFKMITGIAAVESGAITVNEFVRDNGIFYLGHKPACWIYKSRGQTHGNVNLMSALKVSCNYYFYEVSSRMGIDQIAKYARAFGLGDKTGIEVYGESKGTVSSKEYIEEQNNKGAKLTWTIGDTLSSAIGQSYNLYTPLQMANYIATIARKGQRKDITIVKDVVSKADDNTNIQEIKNEVKQNVGASILPKEDVVIKEPTIDAVFEGMRSVTGDRGGTVYGTFNDFPFEVAGKTGTATAGNGSDNAWFVGFAPYDDPQIAVVVIVEHGGHGYFTARAVKDIMKVYFKLDQKSEEIIDVE